VVASVPPEQRQTRLLALGGHAATNGGVTALPKENGKANGKTNGNGNGAPKTNGNGAASSAATLELDPVMALLEPLKAFGYSREALEMVMVGGGGWGARPGQVNGRLGGGCGALGPGFGGLQSYSG
jgi:hypothetical protein